MSDEDDDDVPTDASMAGVALREARDAGFAAMHTDNVPADDAAILRQLLARLDSRGNRTDAEQRLDQQLEAERDLSRRRDALAEVRSLREEVGEVRAALARIEAALSGPRPRR